MLREELHSFQSTNYHTKGFCLKVDLSKAFDRMDWDYLEWIMPLYGFPSKLIMWIMGCIRSTEFSVVLNGDGDGFFKPKCGLRQGCSLSPYLFILGIDLLCRSLENLALTGILRGLKLAPQAAVLTSCVYADDLLLFGDATCGEAELLNKCCSISPLFRVSKWGRKRVAFGSVDAHQKLLGCKSLKFLS